MSGTDSHKAKELLDAYTDTIHGYLSGEKTLGAVDDLYDSVLKAMSAPSEKGPISPTAINAEYGSQPCAPCVVDAQVAEWLYSKSGHRECEDAWYSCSQHPDCADDRRAGQPCDCGADFDNAMRAKVRSLLRLDERPGDK